MNAAASIASWVALGLIAAALRLAWELLPPTASLSWNLPLARAARLVGLAEPALVAVVVTLLLTTLFAIVAAAASRGVWAARWAGLAAAALALECAAVISRGLRDLESWRSDDFTSREHFQHAFAGGLLGFQSTALFAITLSALVAAPWLWRCASAVLALRLLAACTAATAAFAWLHVPPVGGLGLALLSMIIGASAEVRAALRAGEQRPS